MRIKGLVHEDFIQYQKPSMFIATSKCSFKCDKAAHANVCQNSALANSPIHDINNQDIIGAYKRNPITKSIVIGGLEPLDDFDDLLKFFKDMYNANIIDDIVVYTGYEELDVKSYIRELSEWVKGRFIVKYGRFIPNSQSKYDSVLGVTLASDNQYAVVIKE